MARKRKPEPVYPPLRIESVEVKVGTVFVTDWKAPWDDGGKKRWHEQLLLCKVKNLGYHLEYDVIAVLEEKGKPSWGGGCLGGGLGRDAVKEGLVMFAMPTADQLKKGRKVK